MHSPTIIQNRYQLGQLLGSGGMGAVYSAVDLRTTERVAVKVLNSTMNTSPKALRRLRREIELLKSLDSPHIARFLDAGELTDGSPYVVMEYLDGRDLRLELRRRGRIPCAEACSYIRQACRGVAVAHAHGIVHRDLKPSNLVLVNPGAVRTVKVVDFGVAKVLGHADQSRTPSSDAVVGTPLYMAPEQLIRHAEPNHRADLWSLGVVLYELLAGVSPFAAETPGTVVAAVALDEPTPIEQLVPELPFAIGVVVVQLLCKDPAGRPENVQVLIEALSPFCLDDSSLHIVEEPIDPSHLVAQQRKRRNSLPWVPQPQRVPAQPASRDEPVTVRRSAPVYERMASHRPSKATTSDAPTVVFKVEESDGEAVCKPEEQ